MEEYTTTDEELRQLRARRAELAAAREAKEAQLEEQRALDSERRALRDEEALGKLIDEHGPLGADIQSVETDEGLVVVKRASSLKFRRFMDKESFTTEELQALVRPCLLWPTASEFDAMLDRQPMIANRCALAIGRMAGIRNAEIVKK